MNTRRRLTADLPEVAEMGGRSAREERGSDGYRQEHGHDRKHVAEVAFHDFDIRGIRPDLRPG